MTARLRCVLVVLLCAVGCRGERSEQEVPVDSLPAAPRPALAFELAAPDTLGWSQTDSIRVTVRNGTRAPAGPWRLGLTLAAPAVLTDTAGASAVAHESGLTPGKLKARNNGFHSSGLALRLSLVKAN